MSTFIRYVIIAGLAYMIDMGGYYCLIRLGWSPIASNVFVKIVAAIFAFFMHRRFTYQISESAKAVVHAKKYFGLALIYTPISSALIYFLLLVISDPVYAKAIVDVFLFILTYWVTTKFTFTKN
ncbi:GtrA family protein [Herbaspirillum sp. RTI4]|uniref:GtrA family protein n=1 Tax=Herbaspirillum sp. RTI4 TaxID=3048640 RepID=UPI002AB4D4B3|nr:GtrA family protein [Herbaspirillum sp. RTI4]MDY7577610.1 GtrA family protein [Herbaspirillum sp. RTI4]MEA9983281.1 GtrA family protein [Herbaspirillum sp. RTI4]